MGPSFSIYLKIESLIARVYPKFYTMQHAFGYYCCFTLTRDPCLIRPGGSLVLEQLAPICATLKNRKLVFLMIWSFEINFQNLIFFSNFSNKKNYKRFFFFASKNLQKLVPSSLHIKIVGRATLNYFNKKFLICNTSSMCGLYILYSLGS